MVKHNNVIPNAHFHKDWKLHVKTWFDQPAQHKRRRLARATKAAHLAPRPVNRLQPAVHCPTQRYNMKVRLGRGFTRKEIKVLIITLIIFFSYRKQVLLFNMLEVLVLQLIPEEEINL